jgi:hypothetical protein
MSNSLTTRTTTEQEVRIVVMKNPVHPGEVLREDVLADLGLGVGEAASRLGISRVALSRVVHEQARTWRYGWRRPGWGPRGLGWRCSQPMTWPLSGLQGRRRFAASTTSPDSFVTYSSSGRLT